MANQRASDRALLSIKFGECDFFVSNTGSRFFSNIHGEGIESFNIFDIGKSLIAFSDSNEKSSGSYIYDELPTGEAVLATLLVENPTPLPWDSYGFSSLDFTSTEVTGLGMALASAGFTSKDVVLDAIASTIGRYNARNVEVLGIDGETYTKVGKGAREWELSMQIDATEFDVSKIWRLHLELGYSVFYLDKNPSSPRQVFELAKTGGIDQLIGMKECGWLDAKQSAYDLKGNGDIWKFELSQDVASFANAEQGGIIIVGIVTKNINGSDVLFAVRPIPSKSGRLRQYYDIISSRIYPPIDDLRIEGIPLGGGEIICIYIPPQLDSLKPFIVEGGRVGRKYHGGVFSIPRRRGEDSMAMSARDLHSQIAIGRAFLRTGSIDFRNRSEGN
ncbi:AlbA family DNA-binding domain-containing protein [Actinomadura kijaniata]|uniref:AlbA family DNA-binding domain-containing protein n=1 Tax=Actinomadura kijaniata TaxID=46161 RepID=UPI0012FC220E|nr:ATP-binding protein [Actinomadura kijaniata]